MDYPPASAAGAGAEQSPHNTLERERAIVLEPFAADRSEFFNFYPLLILYRASFCSQIIT
jgi:hypothetical protein